MKRALLSLSVTLLFAFASHSAAAQALTINSVTTTESTCEDNGTATVIASGGDTSMPYQYAILTGPKTFPLQSSPTFTTLPAGTYTFQVRDNAGDFAFFSESVAGTYTTINPTFNLTGYSCPNSMDAEIEVNVSGGRAPFQYALINPSVETRPFQGSNVFDNLTQGDYTVQVMDACSNIQTRLVTVPGWTDPIDQWATNIGVIKVCGGSTYDITLYFGSFPIDEDDAMEYRIYDAATNTVIATIPHVQNTNPQANIPAPTNASQGYRIETIDVACSRVVHSFSRTFRGPILTTSVDPVANSCGVYDVELTTNGFDNLFHSDPTTWTITDTGTGTVLESTTVSNQDPSATIYQYSFQNIPVGNYDVCYTNQCGDNFCTNVTVQEPPRSLTSVNRPFWSCMNETTTTTINALNYNLPYDLILESAPADITTAEGTFPTNFAVGSVLTTQTSGTNNFYSYSNMGVGTYVFRVEDNCGNIDRITVDITPADLHLYSFSHTIIPGCTNGNKVQVTNVDNTSTIWIPRVFVDNVLQNTPQILAPNQTVEFPNIPSGTLRVELTVNDVGTPFYGVCPSITVLNDVIAPYEQPTIPRLEAYDCTDGNTVIVAEAEKGLGDYTYELYQGGSLLQSKVGDGTFNVAGTGTFDVRVIDECLNSVNRSITSGAVPTPVIDLIPTCINGGLDVASILFEANPILGASYEWRDPSGTLIGTNRTVNVDPFDSSSEGQYTVNISLPGGTSICMNQANSVIVNTGYCRTLPVELTFFQTKLTDQNTIELNWQTASEENNERFEIERSTDSQNWTMIQSVDGAGTTNTSLDYSAIDLYPVAGKNYYRLKQVDFDGTFTYSDISVETVNSEAQIAILPNVLNSGEMLKVLNRKGTIDQVLVYDMSGRTVARFGGIAANSNSDFQLPELERGIYLVQFIGNDIAEAQKIIIR